MLNLKAVKYDLESSTEGVWTEIEGAEFKIRYAQSPQGSAALHRCLSSKTRDEDGNLFIANEFEAQNKFCAEYLIADWRGILDEDGETELEYSVDNFYNKLCLYMPMLPSSIVNFASVRDNYSLEEQEESLGK